MKSLPSERNSKTKQANPMLASQALIDKKTKKKRGSISKFITLIKIKIIRIIISNINNNFKKWSRILIR